MTNSQQQSGECAGCNGAKTLCVECMNPVVEMPCSCGCIIQQSCMICAKDDDLNDQNDLLSRATEDAVAFSIVYDKTEENRQNA